MKYPFRAALTAGIALAQIGEFSFILASMGRDLVVLPAEATNVLVATSIASIVLNPVAYRAVRPIERWAVARPRLWALLNRPPSVPTDLETPGLERDDPSHRAVVLGFGPTAGILILGSAGMANSAEVIRTARAVNPYVRVLARASYLRGVPALRAAGANSVYSGEGEVALAFIEDILDSLGATPEQIDMRET